MDFYFKIAISTENAIKQNVLKMPDENKNPNTFFLFIYLFKNSKG